MHICYATQPYHPEGGEGRLLRDLSGEMERRGHTVTKVSYENTWLSTLRALRHAAREADIVHAFDVVPYGLLAYASTLGTATPYAILAQGTHAELALTDWRKRWFAEHTYARAASVAAISAYTRDRLLRHFRKNISVLNLGIRFDDFYTSRKTYSRPSIIGVGSVKPRKGYHVSLEAFAIARKSIPDLSYTIVGYQTDTVDYFNSLVRKAHTLGVADAVEFVAGISDAELKRRYSEASLFVLTSINDGPQFEGFGLVFLEAAAAGLPIIGTTGNGIADAVQNGTNGILVPQNDPVRTAEAIIRLLSHNEEWDSMSRASYAWARQHDWSIVGDRFEKWYAHAAGA